VRRETLRCSSCGRYYSNKWNLKAHVSKRKKQGCETFNTFSPLFFLGFFGFTQNLSKTDCNGFFHFKAVSILFLSKLSAYLTILLPKKTLKTYFVGFRWVFVRPSQGHGRLRDGWIS